MDHTIPADDVARLQGELADIARDTARLLLQPGHAESELLELDARAWDLRARIRKAAIRQAPELEPRVASIHSGGRSVSGG